MDRCILSKRVFVSFSTFMSLLFYGTGFPIRQISLSKNVTSLRCYRTVSARWAEFPRMSFLTLSF